MDSTLELLKEELQQNPGQKARLLASRLGKTRGEINALLHSHGELFIQNENSEWLLSGHTELEPNFRSEISEAPRPDYISDNTIYSEELDLVERIKEELKHHPDQKVSELASLLSEPRGLIKRTLHSFGDLFRSNQDSEWSLHQEDHEHVGEFSEATESLLEHGNSHIDQGSTEEFVEQTTLTRRGVIEARLERSFLVLAPPGTGKTHTLVERLVTTLTRNYEQINSGDLLVLSFTRAAVREVRERIAKAIEEGAPARLRYVRVMTFDSYSTWILNDGGYDLSGMNYDTRIRLLKDELKSLRLVQSTDRIARSKYLFIDEIQDLVGIRADLVFELVKRVLASGGAVNLLGDPHQSLNDYQIREGQTDSSQFLMKVKKLLGENLEEFELEKSHRYETESMQDLASNAKYVLDDEALSAREKYNALRKLIPDLGETQLKSVFHESLVDAILCRTNAEAYQWINWLASEGIEATLNSGSMGQPWPGWIGLLLMHYQSDVITVEQLATRISQIDLSGYEIELNDMEEFLSSERLIRGGKINLRELASRLSFASPAEKTTARESGLIVSTVHKAKGLEYGTVLIQEPSANQITAEEVRVLYVAITRAKKAIYLLPKLQSPISGFIRKCRGGHLRYQANGEKFIQLAGLDEFDLEKLFIDSDGRVDIESLKEFLKSYKSPGYFSIAPEKTNAENDHEYALFFKTSSKLIRLCRVNEKLKSTLNAMSFGNSFGRNGACMEIGENSSYQTIVHPVEAPAITRLVGKSGILVFPSIQGFYPLSKFIGEA